MQEVPCRDLGSDALPLVHGVRNSNTDTRFPSEMVRVAVDPAEERTQPFVDPGDEVVVAGAGRGPGEYSGSFKSDGGTETGEESWRALWSDDLEHPSVSPAGHLPRLGVHATLERGDLVGRDAPSLRREVPGTSWIHKQTANQKLGRFVPLAGVGPVP